MVISVLLLRCLIALLAFLCKTLCSILRGPKNVVGIFDNNVTLNCRSNQSQDVRWQFMPYGVNQSLVEEPNFPGHHSTSWSSRGFHSLTLEALKFENAGRYVCRVVGTSGGGRDAAAAFVVVVANPPRCTDSATGRLAYDDSVDMECSVTFVGQHNLTLEWLAPDGSVLRRRHYWSGGKVEVARLLLDETVWASARYNLSTPSYKCRAYFSDGSTHFADQAGNSPEFRRNTCAVLLPVPTISPTRVTTYVRPLASSTTDPMVIVWILAGALVVAVISVISVCVYFHGDKIKSAVRRGRRQTEDRLPQHPDITWNSARCNGQNDNSGEGMPLMVAENEQNTRCGHETSECSPETGGLDIARVHPVAVQPHKEPEQPLSDLESTANLSDATNSTISASPGHQETVNNDIALHEDPPETADEDQFGSV